MNSLEEKEMIRKQTHSQIEKRRRNKIQECMKQLQRLVPKNATQTNLQKLTILENTVEYLKELQRKGLAPAPVDPDALGIPFEYSTDQSYPHSNPSTPPGSYSPPSNYYPYNPSIPSGHNPASFNSVVPNFVQPMIPTPYTHLSNSKVQPSETTEFQRRKQHDFRQSNWCLPSLSQDSLPKRVEK
jgi:hypothetical protein